jgi:hypothetical protein
MPIIMYNSNWYMPIITREVTNMPGRDGTGPLGKGAGTGRGLGLCTGAAAVGMGLGLGLACRRGFGRGIGRGFRRFFSNDNASNKEFLTEQKAVLQKRLEAIEKQLEDL